MHPACAVHGVGESPYFARPLLGPSNPRDATGRVVDMLFDPLTYVAVPVAGMAPPRSTVPVTVQPAALRIFSSSFLIKEPNGLIPAALDP